MLRSNVFRSNSYEPVFIIGRFQPNTAAAIDNTANKGPSGWSAAYSATGVYTVTLDKKYFACLHAEAHLSSAAGQDAKVLVGAIDVASARTVVLNCFALSDGTTAVELVADDDTWIHFMLVLGGTVTK